MQVKEVEEFVKKQQEQLNITSQVELAKVQGFYQGAAQALNTVGLFIAQKTKEETKPEKPAKKETN